MIRVRITSRLGNQLFQYAFAHTTSRQLNTFFIIDSSKAKKGIIITKYFRVTKPFNIVNWIINLYYNKSISEIICQNGLSRPADIIKCVSNFTEYRGYFQSLQYFEKEELAIKKLFQVKNRYKKQFNNKYDELFNKNKTIIVHSRRTDYLTYGKEFLGGKNLCLPDSYILNCFSKIKDVHLYKIIFISDDINYAEQQFSSKFPNATFETNEEIIDFQLLMHGNILILSNSTFAWWGAFLNQNEDKIVYVPRFWLGFKVREEYPIDILPNNWIDIDAGNFEM